MSLAYERGIHRWPVNSPHKGPVLRKRFPFDDVILLCLMGELWIVYGAYYGEVWSRYNWIELGLFCTHVIMSAYWSVNTPFSRCKVNSASRLWQVWFLTNQWFELTNIDFQRICICIGYVYICHHQNEPAAGRETGMILGLHPAKKRRR